MREYRCRKCHRLLFRSPDEQGRVEIVCPDRRCRMIQMVFLDAGPPLRDRAACLTPLPA